MFLRQTGACPWTSQLRKTFSPPPSFSVRPGGLDLTPHLAAAVERELSYPALNLLAGWLLRPDGTEPSPALLSAFTDLQPESLRLESRDEWRARFVRHPSP